MLQPPCDCDAISLLAKWTKGGVSFASNCLTGKEPTMRDNSDGSEGTYLHDLGNIQVNIS